MPKTIKKLKKKIIIKNTNGNNVNSTKKLRVKPRINYNEGEDEVEDSADDLDPKSKIDSLEHLLEEENVISYDPICVRKKTNWSKSSGVYKLDNAEFSPETLLNDIPTHSPKLNALLNKIDELDRLDMKKYKTKFKHFIFSDLKSSTYGAKLIASSLIAKGMNLGYSATLKRPVNIESDSNSDEQPNQNTKPNQKNYNKLTLANDEQLLQTPGNNFYLLTSVSIYDQSITTVDKKAILQKFNQRPDNVHGELARIIVMDSGFKEGIDLFDIKYIHIFEPSVVSADQKQVIGRGTRTCGQRGLDFHPRSGWSLHVLVYDLAIPEKIQGSFLGVKSTIELYLKSMNLDVRLFHFAHDLEKTTVMGSVDYELNHNVHMFNVAGSSDDSPSQELEEEEKDLEKDLNDNEEYVYGGANKTNKTLGGGPKRLIIRRKALPLENTNFEQMRQHIREHFSDFAWDVVKMENLCQNKQTGGSGELIKYTPTQDFIRHYFTPVNPLKGMLLYHSVGTGKTCTAIAAATGSFERNDYTILWVTRTTLKNDIWKNMFDQVCNEQIRNQITRHDLKIPDEQNKRMRLLSKSWRIRPMSYKQFSNLVSKQNAFYKTLVKINGEVDPLRKTLLIIDEAHKLYGGGDLSTIERPDMPAFHRALMNSYQVSGADSVKLLLMTATPITQNPMELIQLINLFKPADQQLPAVFDEFSQKYLMDNGEFSEAGRDAYLNSIAGHISYLNREKDARQFAQPIIENISVPIIEDITVAERFDKKIVREYMDSKVGDLKSQIMERAKELDGELGDLDTTKFNFLKTEYCGEMEGKPKKQCEKVVGSNIKSLIADAKEEVKKIRDDIKEMREQIKNRNLLQKTTISNVKDNINRYEEEYEAYKGSLLFNLKDSCRIKTTGKSALKDIIGEHPKIREFDREIEMYNNKIQELRASLKLHLNKYKQRLVDLKKMLKTDLNELERNVIKMTIRDEERSQRVVTRLTQKDFTAMETSLKNSIQKTEKQRKIRYKKVRKTIKAMIVEEKQRDKELKQAEKKLRKTLRQQGEYKEEIKHELIQGLVGKYQTRIKDDLVDLGAQTEAAEREEVERLAEKQRMKDERVREKLVEREHKQKERQEIREQKNRERAETREQKQRERDAKRKTKKNNK
jgi:hypothetical protein